MSTLDFILQGVAAAIASGETTLEDIVTKLGADDAASSTEQAAAYPTLAQHVTTVTRSLTR